MIEPVRFRVLGIPQPAGSKKAVSIKGRNFTQVVDANRKAAPWKKTVARVAAVEMMGRRIIEGAIGVRFVFEFVRPPSHLLKDGSLSSTGRGFRLHTKKPDALKLARAVEDALTGVVYVDDCNIVYEVISKRWGDENAVTVTVWAMYDDPFELADDVV